MIIGTPSALAVISAGAIPELSIVTTLVTPLSLKWDASFCAKLFHQHGIYLMVDKTVYL